MQQWRSLPCVRTPRATGTRFTNVRYTRQRTYRFVACTSLMGICSVRDSRCSAGYWPDFSGSVVPPRREASRQPSDTRPFSDRTVSGAAIHIRGGSVRVRIVVLMRAMTNKIEVFLRCSRGFSHYKVRKIFTSFDGSERASSELEISQKSSLHIALQLLLLNQTVAQFARVVHVSARNFSRDQLL